MVYISLLLSSVPSLPENLWKGVTVASLPKEANLKDGTLVRIRCMVPNDLEKSVRFFQDLPKEDRQYLRMDVSKREIVARRIYDEPNQQCWRLVAEVGDRIVGDAKISRILYGRTNHTAELRCIIASDFQKKGLGSLMLTELFHIALGERIENLYAEVVREQIGAIQVFESLGFERVLIRSGHVKDMHGDPHDLYIYLHDAEEMWQKLQENIDRYDRPQT